MTNNKKNANVEILKTNTEKNFSFSEILKKVENNTEGLLKSNLGNRQKTLYKESIFENCDEKQQKSIRRKIRKIIISFADNIKSVEDKKLINAFNEFYKETFICTDYSLHSVCNENLSSEKKVKLQNLLDICKGKDVNLSTTVFKKK